MIIETVQRDAVRPKSKVARFSRAGAAFVLLCLAWLAVLAGVARFSDTAPGLLVPYPTAAFLRALPEDVRIADWRPHALILQSAEPGFAKRLYAAGAVLVLPAGLPGCAPLPTQSSPTS